MSFGGGHLLDEIGLDIDVAEAFGDEALPHRALLGDDLLAGGIIGEGRVGHAHHAEGLQVLATALALAAATGGGDHAARGLQFVGVLVTAIGTRSTAGQGVAIHKVLGLSELAEHCLPAHIARCLGTEVRVKYRKQHISQ